MDRRSLLKGAVAVPLAATIPFPAMAAIDPVRATKIAAIKNLFTDYLAWAVTDFYKRSTDDPLLPWITEINHLMVDMNPDLFIDRTMKGPTDLILTDNGIGCTTARTRAFRHQIPVWNIPNQSPEWNARLLVDELAALDIPPRYRDGIGDPYQIMPYAPAMFVRAVCPVSFAPIIGFKMRFGIAKIGAKIITCEEERAYTLAQERKFKNGQA